MRPLAITMGCPAGIGPEIILKYFEDRSNNREAPLVVVGDKNVLDYYSDILRSNCVITPWFIGTPVPTERAVIPIFETSKLPMDSIRPGIFSKETAVAMANAITVSIKETQNTSFSGLCTCPISKEALQESDYQYPGHTEMLAALTNSTKQVMMLAGTSLRVTLATIHCGIAQVPGFLNIEALLQLYKTTHNSLFRDFNIPSPRIAVAALNPHAGEGGMFGTEEQDIILPSISIAQKQGLDIEGPFPPDTLFIKNTKE